jgi:phage terminase small subunit
LIKLEKKITEAQNEQAKRTEITADRVVKELARIAFTDPRKVFRWGPNGVTLLPSDQLTEDEAAIVAEVSETTTESGGSIKGKRFDKLKALELLGRHLGMFVERADITGKMTVATDPFEGLTTDELREFIRNAQADGG